jgi:hypothetical protein
LCLQFVTNLLRIVGRIQPLGICSELANILCPGVSSQFVWLADCILIFRCRLLSNCIASACNRKQMLEEACLEDYANSMWGRTNWARCGLTDVVKHASLRRQYCSLTAQTPKSSSPCEPWLYFHRGIPDQTHPDSPDIRALTSCSCHTSVSSRRTVAH